MPLRMLACGGWGQPSMSTAGFSFTMAAGSGSRGGRNYPESPPSPSPSAGRLPRHHLLPSLCDRLTTPSPSPSSFPLQANYPVTISGQYYPLTEVDNNGTSYPQRTTCGNEMDSEITIHWHGIVQRNSVIMDGVAEVGVT